MRETYRERDAVPVTLDAETVGSAAAQQWLDELAASLDGTILDSRFTLAEEDGAVRVRITAACEEQIAAEMLDRTPLPEPPEQAQAED